MRYGSLQLKETDSQPPLGSDCWDSFEPMLKLLPYGSEMAATCNCASGYESKAVERGVSCTRYPPLACRAELFCVCLVSYGKFYLHELNCLAAILLFECYTGTVFIISLALTFGLKCWLKAIRT